MKKSVLIIVSLFVLSLGCTRNNPTSGGTLPVYATYQFTDQEGKSLHFKTFEGAPTFVSFIFTRCPMPEMCPLTMQKNLRLYEKSRSLKTPLKFVVITIDPVFDTPEVLKEYAKRYKLDLQAFTLLTGTDETVSKMASELANVISMPSASYITHNVKSVLLDDRLQVVEEFKDNEWKPEDVLEKLKTL